jgi:hypothetical protein
VTVASTYALKKIPRITFHVCKIITESCRLRVHISAQKRGLDMEKGSRRASR